MGQLIPIMCDEVIPSDKWYIGNEVVVRMNPMFAPILHELNVFVHYFFVPYRILWDGWEEFITGGQEGTDMSVQPVWQAPTAPLRNSLWDYLGFPVHYNSNNVEQAFDPATGFWPVDYPRRAYNLIFNEYYRDQDFGSERPLTNEAILYRAWEKDYFTSARIDTQRGISPSFPVSGALGTIFNVDPNGTYTNPLLNSQFWHDVRVKRNINSLLPGNLGIGSWTTNPGDPFEQNPRLLTYGWANAGTTPTSPYAQVFPDNGNASGNYNNAEWRTAGNWWEYGTILNPTRLNTMLNQPGAVTYDMSDFTLNADISDLRLSFQIQKFMERNMRAGVRYTEFLKAHFGVAPRDDRLQRPEYIGGSRQPLIISEVLQTSGTGATGTTTAQANMAGHGLSASTARAGRYYATEFGLIMGIMSVMPRTTYFEGINRQWMRKTRYDYPFPEFVNLSEQEIFNGELYVSNNQPDWNNDIFGYQGRFDELRTKNNTVCSLMRSTYAYWHLARKFWGNPNRPALNQTFIEASNIRKDIFAGVTAGAESNTPGLIVNFGNRLRAVRPLPIIAEPGLIDHH